MKATSRRIVFASMFAALTCVATMIIKLPSPLKGYINLGDCMVLLGAWILPPFYGVLAAGIGSALADVFSGYLVYVPATFIIKGLMSIVAITAYNIIIKKVKSLPSRIISGLLAEIVMILGYFLFEGILYGFAPSLINIPANAIQGFAGILIGTLLIKYFEKLNLFENKKEN